MPELVACPSCGCRVQMAESQLGRQTRCISCQTVFVATEVASGTAAREQATFRVRPVEADLNPPRPPMEQRGLPRHRLPLCPGCHRPVGWETSSCQFCGHLFDPLDSQQSPIEFRRYDGEQHRGGLIDTLGTICLLGGTLSLCTGPGGVLIALGTGVPALVMANRDLPRMDNAMVDPLGRPTTTFGRNKAIVGLTLAFVCALIWALFIFGSWMG